MLVPIDEIIEAGRGDAEIELEIRKALEFLADELNNSMKGYEVRIIHLDTSNYLEIKKENDNE